jgi:hypothetical protein
VLNIFPSSCYFLVLRSLPVPLSPSVRPSLTSSTSFLHHSIQFPAVLMSVRASKNYLRVRAGASLLVLTSHSHDEFCNKFTNIIYTLKKSGSFLGRGEEDTIFYSPLLAHVNFEQSRLEDSSLVFAAALVLRRIFHNRRLSLLCAALPTLFKLIPEISLRWARGYTFIFVAARIIR